VNILIVEDEPDIRSALRNRGHWVAWAATGEVALEKLHTETIDVVLLDLDLGSGMSGWDVARHKMQRSEMAHIPVIITSGLSAEAIHSRGNDHPLAGAMLLLGKPIDLDRLDRALETIESAMEPVVPK
jgi:DNA-binding response OmpR family regulator